MRVHGAIAVILFLLAACGDSGSTGTGGGDGGNGNGGSSSNDGGSTSSNPNGTGGSTTDAMTTTDTTTTNTTNTTTGQEDPFAAQRQACIDKINELRASKGLPAYARWVEAEPCVDQQATSDEMSGQAHGAWINGEFPSCNGQGQNECLGGGANGITGCLDSMWSEKDQDGCSGCDACNQAYNPDCPNCDFYGSDTGDVCGHYVNMSALYFTKAACGFSSLGGWAAINFSP